MEKREKYSGFQPVKKETAEIIIADRSTGGNILWATDDYMNTFAELKSDAQMTVDLLCNEKYKDVICPRFCKSSDDKKKRTRVNAEVFTPAWLCNMQNNLNDRYFLQADSAFNEGLVGKWITNKKKIEFKQQFLWKDYVLNNVLEVTCGEAPYLTGRYDTVLGYGIPIGERIGLLDRKFRVVKENTTSREDFLRWMKKAVEHTYGFELQGDNLLIARMNVLSSFCEFYEDTLREKPNENSIAEIARVISWNLWQMDGTNHKTPYSAAYGQEPCRIMDWDKNKVLEFNELLEKQ